MFGRKRRLNIDQKLDILFDAFIDMERRMTNSVDHLTASANKLVGVVEALLAANAKAADDLRAANAATNDPAIEAVAQQLDAEADKAQLVLTPPAPVEPAPAPETAPQAADQPAS